MGVKIIPLSSGSGGNVVSIEEVTTANNAVEEAAAFAAGSKIVVRLDLL